MTVSGLKRAWNEVRRASGLKWFRPYDTRHTAITRWAEAGMNISDIMALAGHVSARMTMHYTHISQQSKRRALEAVAARKPPGSERPDLDTPPFYVRQSSLKFSAFFPVFHTEVMPRRGLALRPFQRYSRNQPFLLSC